MRTIPHISNIPLYNSFDVKGEEFVVLKKDHLKELIALFNSVIAGEKLLKIRKTRSFEDFIKSTRKKAK